MALGEEIQKGIAWLPADLQNLVQKLLPMLQAQSEQWLAQWIRNALLGNLEQARTDLFAAMSTEQIAAMQSEMLVDLDSLNDDTAASKQAWYSAIDAAITATVDVLVKAAVAAVLAL